jgi:hypothetical protein
VIFPRSFIGVPPNTTAALFAASEVRENASAPARRGISTTITPYDAKKVTASLAYVIGDDTRGVAWMLAFGQNREIHGNLEAYLFEANIRTDARTTLYTRAESVAKGILDAGFHPRGTFDVTASRR